MAARKRRLSLDENWRLRIKTGMLINLLQRHANGKAEMSQSQVRAAEILLRKTLPDLSTVELSGEVQHNYVVRCPPEVKSVDEWTALYVPRDRPN